MEYLSLIERVLASKRVERKIGSDWEEMQVKLGFKQPKMSESEALERAIQKELQLQQNKPHGFEMGGGSGKEKSAKKKKRK